VLDVFAQTNWKVLSNHNGITDIGNKMTEGVRHFYFSLFFLKNIVAE
jgi:hypothetical protein